MKKPAAFQIAPIGDLVLFRPMNQAEYNAYLHGESVSENTIFEVFNIPNGHEIANIVISANGEIAINVVRKN